MKKNYISEIHISRNETDNLYLFVSINEKEMLKDKNSFHVFFTNRELINIFNQTVSKKIFIQDWDKKIYPIDKVATVSEVSVLNDPEFKTYLLVLKNNLIEFPARILFEYSFNFRYYNFLNEKLKDPIFRSQISKKVDFLYREISSYEESMVNFKYANTSNSIETIHTDYIDFRKYNSVKEKVVPTLSIRLNKSFLSSLSFDENNFLNFNSILVDGTVKEILNQTKENLVSFYSKLINTTNDYDYKRYLNTKSIFLNPKQEVFTSPQVLRTNTANTSTFSERDMFKEENIKLKIDESPDSKALFLMMAIQDGIKTPIGDQETADFLNFLSDPFNYPNYFFKNVLKYQIEYLSNLEPKSMNETWTLLTSGDIPTILEKQNIFCRISLKDKKYFDKVAHEYFLLEA